MGVHATERVAQLIFGFVSVSQLSPRMASHAVSRGVTRNRVDMCGTLSALDSISSTKFMMDLTRKVPLNKRRVIEIGSEQEGICVRARNSGETKQSEAPESNRMRVASDRVRRGRMKESLFGTAASVAVYGIGQFASCNE
jgi:hypothetical protein